MANIVLTWKSGKSESVESVEAGAAAVMAQHPSAISYPSGPEVFFYATPADAQNDTGSPSLALAVVRCLE